MEVHFCQLKEKKVMKLNLDSKNIPIVKSWLWDYDFFDVYSYNFDFFLTILTFFPPNFILFP